MSAETSQEALAAVPSTTTSDDTTASAETNPAGSQVEALDEAGYRNLISNLDSISEPQEQEPVQQNEQSEPKEGEQAEETQENDDQDDLESGDGSRLPERLRVGSWPEEERKALLLRQRNPDMSLAEALERVRGNDTQKSSNQESNQLPSPEEIQTQIAALKTERAEAKRNFDADKELELEDKIEAARNTLERIRIEAARAQQAEASRFEQTVESSKGKAVDLYPDVTDANSALVQKMMEIDAMLKDSDNPMFFSPDKPLKVAQMAANELGIAPRNPNAKQPASPRATTTPRQQTNPQQVTNRPATTPIAPAAARTSRPSQAVINGTADDLLAKITDEDGIRAILSSMN
jgi:hypothetical protein